MPQTTGGPEQRWGAGREAGLSGTASSFWLDCEEACRRESRAAEAARATKTAPAPPAGGTQGSSHQTGPGTALQPLSCHFL